MKKNNFNSAALLSLATLLAISIDRVYADGDPSVGVPDYSVKQLPLASTFYWFSSVELGVCYSPAARVGSIKGALYCTHQDKYDIDNNTWTLPQTCVALKPLGGPLSSSVRESCTNAKGTFNVITPAQSNAEGGQAFNAIQHQNGGAVAGSGVGADARGAGTGPGAIPGAGAESTSTGAAPDSNEQEDKNAGFLGSLGGLIGL